MFCLQPEELKHPSSPIYERSKSEFAIQNLPRLLLVPSGRLRGNGGWELSAQVLWVGCNTCKIMAVGLAADLMHQCFAPLFPVLCLCDCLILPGEQGQVDVWSWCTRDPVTTHEGFLFKWKSNILFYIGCIVLYYIVFYSILHSFQPESLSLCMFSCHRFLGLVFYQTVSQSIT